MIGISPFACLARQGLKPKRGTCQEEYGAQQCSVCSVAHEQREQRTHTGAVPLLAVSAHRWPHLTACGSDSCEGNHLDRQVETIADQYRKHAFEYIDEHGYPCMKNTGTAPQFDVNVAYCGVKVSRNSESHGERQGAQEVAADYESNRAEHTAVTRCPQP